MKIVLWCETELAESLCELLPDDMLVSCVIDDGSNHEELTCMRSILNECCLFWMHLFNFADFALRSRAFLCGVQPITLPKEIGWRTLFLNEIEKNRMVSRETIRFFYFLFLLFSTSSLASSTAFTPSGA